MGNLNVGVHWDCGIVTLLTVGDAIFHEHWNAIELHILNLNTRVT